MAITSIMRDWGVDPAIVRITSSDSLADVVQPNYVLDQEPIISVMNNGTWEWVVGDIVVVNANDGSNFFRFDGADFSTLIDMPGGGGGAGFVELNPSADQTIVGFDLILGNGDYQAGLPGIQGNFISHTTGETGSLVLAANEGIADYVVQIRNAIFGQSTTINIPDAGNSEAVFLTAATVSPFVNGNFPMAFGTEGAMVDSGVSASSLSDIGKIVYVDADITAAELASGGKGYVIVPSPGESYKVRSVMCNASTGLSGGGGDRGLFFRDDTAAYATLTDTLCQSPVNTCWGDNAGLDFGVLATNRTSTVGIGIWLEYFGGTTDYASGTISFTVGYERVT